MCPINRPDPEMWAFLTPCRLCPSDVRAVSEERLHEKGGGEQGDAARVRYSRENEAARVCGGRGPYAYSMEWRGGVEVQQSGARERRR